MSNPNQQKQIRTELVSFEDIISNHFFKIPDYQRGYSWEKKQLDDLKKDIENLYTSNYRHFTGTIVATECLDSKYTFSVVDGQQRITTLIILLNEASKILKDDSLVYTYIKRGDIGREKYVLETNEETKVFFTSQILKNQSPSAKVKSHIRIREAQKYFSKWFNEENVNIQKIVDLVTQQFGFIFFSPEDTKEIGIMFEVINNRGKPLSELEKIKNYFIYYASINEYSTFRNEINQLWSNILINLSNANVFSNNDENRFLRNCYLVFFDTSKNKSWHVYEELKLRFNNEFNGIDQCETDFIEIKEFIEFLEQASLHYAYLFNKNTFNETYDGESKQQLSYVLKQLRCQPTKASVLPLFLAAMTYLKSHTEKTLEILNLIEITNFRIYLLPKITSRADSLQGHLFKLANNFFDDRDWLSSNKENKNFTHYGEVEIEGDIFDWVKEELVQFTLAHCSETKFIQSLTIDDDEADDYYHWEGIRFFLACYEEFEQDELKTTFDIQEILKQRADVTVKNNDFLSLEHIWASENRSDDFERHHKEKRRLGNFVLLGLSKNIQLSKDDIPSKIKELNNNDKTKGFGHMALRQVSDLNNYLPEAINFLKTERGWKIKSKNYYKELSIYINDTRETELIHFALKRWKLPNEKLDDFIKVDSFLSKGNNENFILKNR